MQITIEDQRGLNARLSARLTPEDYSAEVEKELKTMQKKMRVPGFRPGNAPIGLVKRMAGKDVKHDVILRILQKGLDGYFKEQNLDTILPAQPDFDWDKIDWNGGTEFAFSYKLGLRPEVEVNLDAIKGLSRYKVNVSPEERDEDIQFARRRQAKSEDIATFVDEEGNEAYLTFEELDEEGQTFEGGKKKNKLYKTGELPAPLIEALMGKEKGHEAHVNLFDIMSEEDIKTLFGIDDYTLRDLNKNFRVTLAHIFKLQLPELNEEFYRQVLGEDDTVSISEEEFRTKWQEKMEGYMGQESHAHLKSEVKDRIIQSANFDLPEEFLRDYYLSHLKAEGPEAVKDFDKRFEDFLREMRWVLICDKIEKEQGYKIEQNEIAQMAVQHVSYDILQAGYRLDMFAPDQLAGFAADRLKDEDYFSRMYAAVREEKALTYLVEAAEPQEEEIESAEFRKRIHGK